jgi:hypothetical protein
MPKVSPLQGNFNAGEISPLMYGRVDVDRYKAAMATCENWIPMLQGGLNRRPGTYFVGAVKDSTKSVRLERFEFSTTQAYVLEFGDEYIRFFRNNGPVTLTNLTITGATQTNPVVVTSVGHGLSNDDRVIITGVLGMTELNNREFKVANVAADTFELKTAAGTDVNGTGFTAYSSGGIANEIYELVSPYDHTDVFELKFAQSADVLYITHPSYAPRKLTRTAHTSWTITEIDFLDGPYLSTNSTSTTLTPSAATGTGVTLTASAVTGINNGEGFKTTDVGRLIRIKEGSVWGYVEITGWTSTTVVTVTVVNTLTNTNAKTSWRLGVWSATTGYPSCVTFHEDRLFFAGPSSYPQRLDGSKSGDYENFAPAGTDGTVASDNAVGFSLNANDVNTIRWMSSDEKGLQVGTVGGEWGVRAASLNEALSPTNISAKPATKYGSADIQPVQVGKATIFVQRAGRKVREMQYYFDVDGFRATNMTEIAEHITQGGITQIAYQKEPQSMVWAVRGDGALIGMTYERDIDSLRVGWHRHWVGGVSDAADNPAEVESIAVIPAADGTRDELWILVKRYVNGAQVRHIEYVTKLFEDDDEQEDGYFVDCGLTYDNPLTISGITKANPAVVTATSHGFSNGDTVLISEVLGMDEVNGNTYTVANKTANTFELSGTNSSSYTTYVSGGEARKLVTTVSGLNHLEGETLQVCADGAALPDVTVSSGRVTISESAAVIHLGYGYNSDGKLLRLEAGAADGTALGKTRRIHRVGIMLHRSLGLKMGPNFDDLDTIVFRTSADPLTRAVPLFSGIKSINVAFPYDMENQICFRQSQPLPSTVLAIMPQMITQDR